MRDYKNCFRFQYKITLLLCNKYPLYYKIKLRSAYGVVPTIYKYKYTLTVLSYNERGLKLK